MTDSDKDTPGQVEWITLWDRTDNTPLLDRRGFLACLVIAGIGVAGWILTEILTA